MRTEWEFSNEDGKLDRQYGEELFRKGIPMNFTPRTEEEWANTPQDDSEANSPIPDTDLIRIAEREVIEAAKAWKIAQSIGGSEKLFAAVSLLEARENLKP